MTQSDRSTGSVATVDRGDDGDQRIDRYDPAEVEPRWRRQWQIDERYRTRDDDPRPPYFS